MIFVKLQMKLLFGTEFLFPAHVSLLEQRLPMSVTSAAKAVMTCHDHGHMHQHAAPNLQVLMNSAAPHSVPCLLRQQLLALDSSALTQWLPLLSVSQLPLVYPCAWPARA